MLKFLTWSLLAAFVAILSIPLGIIAVALQDAPLVKAQLQLNQDNVARIKHVLRDADPRWIRVGESRQLSLIEDDFNLILNYGLSHFWEGAVHVELREQQAEAKVALSAPPPFKTKYFNTSFLVNPTATGFEPGNWQLGSASIPDWAARIVATQMHSLLQRWSQYRAVLEALESIEFSQQAIEIHYHWRQDLKEHLRSTGRDLLFDAQDQDRMRFYNEKIYLLSRQISRRGSLNELLSALFDSASRESVSAEVAVQENRALLLALTFHLARVDMNNFLSEPTQRLAFYWLFWPTLAERYDLARHFVISAGIAASAGTSIAAGAGLFKELRDSQGGSGFSFADLAADRAGTRFAELALNPKTALWVQEQMRAATRENLYMPDIDKLPEGIQALEFTEQFANLDNEAYHAISNEIERRIAQCALYQL